jgi:hypothetical protein
MGIAEFILSSAEGLHPSYGLLCETQTTAPHRGAYRDTPLRSDFYRFFFAFFALFAVKRILFRCPHSAQIRPMR